MKCDSIFNNHYITYMKKVEMLSDGLGFEGYSTDRALLTPNQSILLSLLVSASLTEIATSVALRSASIRTM